MKTAKTLIGILTSAAMLCVAVEIQAQTNESPTSSDFRAKAEKGDAASQCNYGITLVLGNMGATKDAVEGVKWIRKAAEQNYAPAQTKMGICYENGYGVETNVTEAVKWFCKAAEQNCLQAECCLGNCCLSGIGLPQDMAEADKWFHRAAEQNDARSQFDLGIWFCDSSDPKMSIEGYKWIFIAAAQGYPDAKKKADAVRPHLSADAIYQINEQVHNFTPKIPAKGQPTEIDPQIIADAQALIKKADAYAEQEQAKIDGVKHLAEFEKKHADDNNSRSSRSVGGSSHKSARQLIRDRAEALHGRNADVTIDSGYAGGAYTVTIADHDKFHTYTYAVTVDEAAQKITSWELTATD